MVFALPSSRPAALHVWLLSLFSCVTSGLGSIASLDFDNDNSEFPFLKPPALGLGSILQVVDDASVGSLTQPWRNGSRPSFCSELEQALPFLSKEVERQAVEGEQACVAPVKEDSCISKHPFWSCSFRTGRCLCRWSSACHGVSATLEAAAGARLLCQPSFKEVAGAASGPTPEADLCRCSGFKTCPEKNNDWNCSLTRAVPASKSQDMRHDVHQASNLSSQKSEGNGTQAPLATIDLCSCRSEGRPVLIWLNSAERRSLREHPLSEIVVLHHESGKPKTGVSGKTIKTKVHHQSTSEKKERIVLTVSDTKKGSKVEEAELQGHVAKVRHQDGKQKSAVEESEATAPAAESAEEAEQSEELEERCVVTDGLPEVSFSHVLVLAVMVGPLSVVLLVITTMRLGLSPCCPASRARPPGGAVPGREHPPGSSEDPSSATAYGLHSLEAQCETDQRPLAEKRPPNSLVVCLTLLVVLLRINITVILSTAHILVDQNASASTPALPHKAAAVHAEGHELAQAAVREEEMLGGISSGLLIAAAPFGGVIGIVLAERTRLWWPKEVFLGSCLCILMGNLGCLIAIRLQSFSLMLLMRAFAGLAEGTCFVGQTVLARLSSPKVRTEVFSVWEVGTAAGLVLGPALTSSAHGLLPGNSRMALQGGVWITIGLSAALLAVLRAFVPESEELRAMVGVDPEERPAWQVDQDMSEEKWSAVLVTCSSTTVRLLGRLIWEASAVMVLAAHYCLGYADSGYAAPIVILFHLVAQASFVQICSWMTDHTLMRGCEFVEVCGLLLMSRPPRDLEKSVQDDIMVRESAIPAIELFLFGSALFYSGNCLMSAPLNSWGTKQGPREACVLFYQCLAVQVGVCAGVTLSRVFLSVDPHQNTLVLVLLPAVVMQIFLSELALGARALERESATATEATTGPGKESGTEPGGSRVGV